MSRIGRLTATIAVPDSGDLPLGTLDRVGTAVTERVPVALLRRFTAAPEPVSGAVAQDRPVVLIRWLQVSAAVPASASADEIAERLADRLARAIRTAPDEGQVRYTSRASHIAAFVAALSGGTGDAWVFESFDGARLLAPLTALRTLAERYAVPVVAVVGELFRAGDLGAVLVRASAAELTRTWAACLAVPHPRLNRPEALRRLGPDPVDDAGPPARPGAEAMSLLLAARAFSRGEPAGPAVAVAVALAASGGGPGGGAPVRESGREGPSVPREEAGRTARGAGPAVFEAAGAPAFLLLPSFEKAGLGELTPVQRARVLATATRTAPDDPAITLAAGVDDGPATAAGPQITAVVQQALIDDDRLGRERLETFSASGHLIVADATSGIWLAILDPGEPIGSALIPALSTLPCTAARPDDALTARITADLRFLLPDDAVGAQRAVAVAARAGLGHFARRLAGFGASSLPYLSDRFLTPGGMIADLGESLWVRLPSPPLLVVLALAGLGRTTVTVTWLQPTVIITHEDTG